MHLKLHACLTLASEIGKRSNEQPSSLLQAEDMEKEIDVDLYAELMQHLTIAPAANNTSSKMQPGSSTSKSAGPQISLDEFVVLTYPLIDLEKQAEIAHASPSRTLNHCHAEY